jgi:hypothetical protein
MLALEDARLQGYERRGESCPNFTAGSWIVQREKENPHPNRKQRG